MFNIFFSPLEQFDVFPLIRFYLGNLDFSVTNQTVSFFTIFFLVSFYFLSSVKPADSTLYIAPHRWQIVLELLYKAILSLIATNIEKQKGQLFFPLLFSLFSFILFINVCGLVPYSYAATSHIIVTFSLSIIFFLGINIISYQLFNLKIFSIFLPSGVSIILSLLITPIELMSFIFKPVSLATRVFANITAGHILLKIIAIFGWLTIGASGLTFFTCYLPLLAMAPLLSLEFVVACMQSIVFTILAIGYLNDMLTVS
jgi:ATP synthase subunit 6